MWLSFDGTLLYTNFYRRCQDSKTAQHWLASSFSTYRNENFLGGAFWGTVYPKDISYGGTKDIMYGDTKNRGCQISYDTGDRYPAQVGGKEPLLQLAGQHNLRPILYF